MFSATEPRFTANRRVLADTEQSIERFFAGGVLELRNKVGPINWQFMATKKYDPADFEGFLKLLPKSVEERAVRHAVEVRHDSFQTPDSITLARNYGVEIVVARDSDYPQINDITAPLVYAHIMGAANVEAGGYTDDALDEWTHRAV